MAEAAVKFTALEVLLRSIQFQPTAPQRDLLNYLCYGTTNSEHLELPAPKPETLLLLGRGSGKSTLAILTAFYHCFTEPGSQVLLCSLREANTSNILLKYAKAFAANIKSEFNNTRSFWKQTSKRDVLSFRNGSEIRFLPNLANAVRGYGPKVIILDEIATWPWVSAEGKDLPTFLSSIRPRMLAQYRDKYKILMLTTPKQAAGPVWDMTQNPGPDLAVVKAPTYVMRPETEKGLFEKLSKTEMRREIECEFCTDEDAPIDLDLLCACERKRVPHQDADRLVLAIDPGFRQDYTGFTVASRTPEDTIHVHKLKRMKIRRDLGGFIPAVKALQDQYNQPEIVLDQFSGDALIALLRTEGIHAESIPWTVKNRDQAFDYLRVLLEDQQILIPESDILRQEIAGLRVTYTKTGHRRIEHGAGHDDLLFSLLLAVENLRTRVRPRMTIIWPSGEIERADCDR